jgi:photosystem II stability/assembly factor-like uncharacterized protein
MNLQPHVYVGTAGHSAWFSEDGGSNWVHPNSHSGMYLEARVWNFASHPQHPDWLLAGTDMGLFQWHESSARWTAIASPLQDVWAVGIHPSNPNLWFIGSRPAGICRSLDAGKTWQTLDVPGLQQFSTINMGATRVTQILFDPIDPQTLWLTVEIGGIYVSHDAGDTWQPRDVGLISADVHGIAILDKNDGQRLMYATTNQGLHHSTDGGLHWEFQEIDSPWQYTRAIVPRLDNTGVVFLTNGNGPPGNRGRLLISQDFGAHWQEVVLPGIVNSTVWTVATDPEQPMRLWACTNLGQVFVSHDGGWQWERLPQEFGEIRALHWRPLPTDIRQQDHSLTRRVAPV